MRHTLSRVAVESDNEADFEAGLPTTTKGLDDPFALLPITGFSVSMQVGFCNEVREFAEK